MEPPSATALDARFARREREPATLQHPRQTSSSTLAKHTLAVVYERQARNARTPFGRLPVEVLIPIVLHLAAPELHTRATASCARALSAVSTAVRALVLDMPALWAHIDLAWDSALVARCVARAAGLPLHIRTARAHPAHAAHRLRALLPRAASVHAADADAVRATLAAHTPLLTALSLARTSPHAQGILLRPEDVPSDVRARLTRLRLHGVRVHSLRVHGLPALPALQHVELHGEVPELDTLCDFFAHAPALRSISLSARKLGSPWDRDATYGGELRRGLQLPHLRSLRVDGNIGTVASVLNELPVPTAELWITVDEHGSSPYATRQGNPVLGGFVERFWARRAGDALPLPEGRLHVVALTPHMTRITLELESPTMNFRCYYQLTDSRSRKNLLFRVCTLTIQGPCCPATVLDQIFTQPENCAWLKGVTRIVIQNADYGTTKPANAAIFRPLEAWIASPAAGALSSVEFVGCGARVKPLYWRLEAVKAGAELTWR